MRCFPPALAILVLTLAGCSGGAALAERDAEIALLREDLDGAYAEVERLRAENDELTFRLRQQMDAEVQGGGARGETVAVLPTDIFFESGSAQLLPEGAARLAEVAGRLRAEFAGRAVRVEGYTDDKPIGPGLQQQYPSNWELSAARAAAVARHLQRTHGFEGAEIEVVGLSQYHPATSNATPEGRQQNRRVRIAVMGG